MRRTELARVMPWRERGHEMERFAGTQSCRNETTRNNAPQGFMWHNKTKSSLVRDQNQSLKRIGTVLVRWVDSVYLDRNSKNIHRMFCRVYLPPKLILRHASWLLATDGSKSFLVAQTAGWSWEKAIMDAFSLTQALLNEYGEKVNGSLIHANRLAFGRTRGYLCIAAAPWRVMHQPSLHERRSTTSNRNVKYNPNTWQWKS